FAVASAASGYTVEQAQAGRDLYSRNCAVCHTPTLIGSGNAPPLAGVGFLSNWRGKPASELFYRIKSTMPPAGNPALTEDDYAAIVAFVLQSNTITAGTEKLRA